MRGVGLHHGAQRQRVAAVGRTETKARAALRRARGFLGLQFRALLLGAQRVDLGLHPRDGLLQRLDALLCAGGRRCAVRRGLDRHGCRAGEEQQRGCGDVPRAAQRGTVKP